MKPVYSCTMFVRFRKLKTNENYNDKLRENHQTSKKRNDNLRLCPYNVNDDGRLERIPHKKRIAVTLIRSSTWFFLILQST